uniref:EamA domain-containing protein n=1 Tax=Panagrolaimus sp. PS1159 TaxID=55785 RepID=A0AC35F0I2_9BILA
MGIFIARNLPKFNLTAAIGGFLYATGNIASVPIVKGIGIGSGMLIWGSIQITVGWCVARFGLFGTKIQQPLDETLNYVGVALTLISGLIFVFVKNDSNNAQSYDLTLQKKRSKKIHNEDDLHSISGRFKQKSTEFSDEHYYATVRSIQTSHDSKNRKLNCLSKTKFFCILMSIGLGLLHGCMLTPIVYIQDNDPHASQNVLDYVFSHFSAVYTFSTLYFIIYSIFKRGKPFIDSRLILPSVLYGILWSIGMILFFISNHKLSQTVSYPITARLPAIIGALTDVFIFRSIKGVKNLTILSIGIIVGLTGVILVGISNQV